MHYRGQLNASATVASIIILSLSLFIDTCDKVYASPAGLEIGNLEKRVNDNNVAMPPRSSSEINANF